MSKRLLIFGVMLALVVLAIIFFSNQGQAPRQEEDILDEEKNSSNEMFLGASFLSLAGKETVIDQYLSGPEDFFLLDVWASWCSPCVAALTDYQKNLNYFRENKIKIIAISLGEPKNTVTNFVEKNGLTFEILLDDKEIALKKWGVKSIPHVFLLNKRGDLLMSELGYLNFSDFETKINKAIAGELAGQD